VTKRDYCINELVETEKNYIEALAMIINVSQQLVRSFDEFCRFILRRFGLV